MSEETRKVAATFELFGRLGTTFTPVRRGSGVQKSSQAEIIFHRPQGLG